MHSPFGKSIRVAAIANLGVMVLGRYAAFALNIYQSKLKTAHHLLVSIPLVRPEILMGMSVLLLFVAIGQPLSLLTVTLA